MEDADNLFFQVTSHIHDADGVVQVLLSVFIFLSFMSLGGEGDGVREKMIVHKIFFRSVRYKVTEICYLI